MHIDFLLEVMAEAGDNAAIVFHDRAFSYRWLLDRIRHWTRFLDERQIAPGSAVVLRADFSPDSVALLLSLIERGTIVVPLTGAVVDIADDLVALANADWILAVDTSENVSITAGSPGEPVALYETLRGKNHPGLVLFSSGSTGKSKGAVHDLSKLLLKFRRRRQDLKTLAFLLFDHIGGLDTLFYCLSNASTIVVLTDRSPDAVCRAIEQHRIEVLPVAPSFLSLLALSEAYKRYDLSSLRYVTYGAEVMPQETLQRCVEMFPGVTILQKYGTTEVGTLRSRSRSSDSLWVKLGGEGYQWRVRDSMLEIKAESAMLGYLNAPSPFTADGWFITGDCVEVDGEYLRILGRKSDMINVGGQKVYPAEVENVIRTMSNVADVTVYGERNAIVGSIVCARVALVQEEEPGAFRQRLKAHCASKLEPYKVPVKIIFKGEQVNQRFKKIRRSVQ